MEKQIRKKEYAGPYILTETLGKGGLATVKVGVESETGTRVAVKIVDKEKLSNQRDQISMTREITIMKLLKHRNILRLHDIYESQEKIYLILDLYEGGDLYGYLTQKGAIPPTESLGLFKQIISGVEYCHKHLIVHRDLKPENLLLSANKKHLVISDFGLSTGMQGSRNLLKTRCGTVHYISPEVAKGDLYVGMASDIWSCGIILYAISTASLPFDGPTSVAVLKKIVRGEYNMPSNLPSELQELIRLMLNLNPKERITIPQIKQHPWYLGVSGDTPRQPVEEIAPTEAFNPTLKDIQENGEVLENLKLLGWEESELMDELLSLDMNPAKVFYKLLIEHNNLPADDPEATVPIPTSFSPVPTPAIPISTSPPSAPVPSNVINPFAGPSHVDKKVLRRRSVAAPTRTHVTQEPTRDTTSPSKSSHTSVRRRSDKHTTGGGGGRAHRTVVRHSERPLTRHNRGGDTPPQEQSTSPESDVVVGGDCPASVELTLEQETPVPGDVPMVTTPEKGKPVIRFNSDTKKIQVDSNKNITQLLDSLRNCFTEMGQYDLSTKQTKTGIKVKARKSAKGRIGIAKGPVEVTVNLQQREDGETEMIFKGGKSKQQFQELAKKMEETLLV